VDAYVDIRLLPDPEFPVNVLMNALYGKLHRGLAAQGGQNIGLSFPDVTRNGLGARLRLHGSAVPLASFMVGDWLRGMRDHITISETGPVPTPKGYRVVRRVQAKSNPERLRRRLVMRKGISAEQAKQAIPDSAAERLTLPYVILNSQTTGQQFRLFVEHLPLQEQPSPGPFSAYGLSSTATVPWF
jgi:CRISPR-associated endonuclease Csy4